MVSILLVSTANIVIIFKFKGGLLRFVCQSNLSTYGYTTVENARNFLSKEKSGAAWLAMIDVGEYINISAVSRNYFNKSTNWLSQRLHGYEVNGKPAKFKPNEYAQLSDALRDIARRLNESADRIDAANVDE